MAQNSLSKIADDNGYYSHKIARFDAKGNIRTDKYDSIIGTAQEAQTSLSGELANMYQADDGVRFVCDPSVQHPINIRSQEYGESVENRVLVNHGIARAGLFGQDIELATALPVRDYYSPSGQKKTPLINGQMENMQRPVYRAVSENADPEPIANIRKSRVLAEGVSALMDFLVDDKGNFQHKREDIFAPTAVLDFGGSTFDVLTMGPSQNILQNNSDTMKRGTLDIRQQFSELLKEHLLSHGIPIEQPASWMIEQAFKNGEIKLHQKGELKRFDVRDILKKAKEPVVQEVKRFTKSNLGDLSGYQFILLVGGGALLCEDLFEDWMQQYSFVVRDEYANARGMLKFITYLDPS